MLVLCVARAGLVNLRLNALRARDRGNYLLHMERYTRAGELLFTLQVTIGVHVLGVRSFRCPLVPSSSLSIALARSRTRRTGDGERLARERHRRRRGRARVPHER